MNAVVFHEHGGPGKLQYQEVPAPTLGPDEVLVRVKACALNHLDIWIRQGSPAYPMPLPHISGSDIAGVVEQLSTLAPDAFAPSLTALDESLATIEVTGSDEDTALASSAG